jgi:3-mercaptopyruvate sulfurtransferase SseA
MMKTRSAQNEPAASVGVLVDADWLDAHLHDPAVRVVEVDVSRRAHDECAPWFVLAYLLGRERVRVYDGSWAEWGRMPEAPVEQA